MVSTIVAGGPDGEGRLGWRMTGADLLSLLGQAAALLLATSISALFAILYVQGQRLSKLETWALEHEKRNDGEIHGLRSGLHEAFSTMQRKP